MLFQFQVEGELGISGFPQKEKWISQEEGNSSFASQEPTSVLHMRRSPSPPTSASTLSSSFNGGGALSDTTTKRKDEWAMELQPIPGGLDHVSGGGSGPRLEDWEAMLSEPAALASSQDNSLFRWISGEVDESFSGMKQLLQGGNGGFPQGLEFENNAGLRIVDQAPRFDPGNPVLDSAGNISGIGANLGGFHCSGDGNGKSGHIPGSSAPMGIHQKIQNPIFPSPANNLALPAFNQGQFAEDKPQILNPQLFMNQQQQQQQLQNPNFFIRHDSGSLPFFDPGQQQQQQQIVGFPPGLQFQKPMGTKQRLLSSGEELAQQQQQHQFHLQQQQHALLDQLYKAAEMVGNGNFSHAQGILARLNQHLSPVGKPLHRAAFYFKEALQLLLVMNNNNNNNNNNPASSPSPRNPTPFDVIFKMGAYKVFSEVSPLIQFVNFTCNQALLEALDDTNCIHIVDFDIGFGAQWASFMQELPMRSRGAPTLRITAFASPSTHHPLELGLMQENLSQFANEIGLSFELEVINIDLLEQSSLPILRSNENEAIAVNFPVWSSWNQPSALPSLIRIVKQLSPKIVVSLDTGLSGNNLPFPQHLLNALQSYTNLLESLDAANVNSDAVNKIEKFLFQPKIESFVLGRLRAPEKMPPWKSLFTSAGFSPVPFSNFAETQADCLFKRTQARGFHVEKRQASLVLYWQHRELVSASAWRC